MTVVRAQAGSTPPVSPDLFGSRSALGLLLVSGALEAESSPWPRRTTPSPTDARTRVELLAWDLVDEWGAQSFPASDPPANW
jgi:hypothetical protein